MALVVVDAGVLIGALDSDDRHHEEAVQALRWRTDEPREWLVPASVFAEILVGPFRHGREQVELVESFLLELPARIESATPGIAREAARLRADHGGRLKLPDALVVATALEADADALLTTDRNWPSVGVRIEVVGPPV